MVEVAAVEVDEAAPVAVVDDPAVAVHRTPLGTVQKAMLPMAAIQVVVQIVAGAEGVEAVAKSVD